MQTSPASTLTVLFKPVELFAVFPVRPSEIPGKLGAVIQFVVPTLRVSADDVPALESMALACGAEVEGSAFSRPPKELGEQPGTLVSIAFHYDLPLPTEDAHGDKAERIGRLLAERFLSFISFAAGERFLGIHQQVTRFTSNGPVSANLHFVSKRTDKPRGIDFAVAVGSRRPSEEVFKALFWLRRGIADRDHLDEFAALMVSLQILATILVPAESTINRCPHCQAPLGTLSRSSVRALVVSVLGGSRARFNRLWKLRNAIVAHGNKPVTADVLHDVVEMKLDAIRLAFKAMRLALGLPPDGPPQPSPIIMITDTFFGAE